MMTRRVFGGALAAGASTAMLAQEGSRAARDTAEWRPFDVEPVFRRKDAPLKLQPFPMTQVRLAPGPFRDAQEANRAVLNRIPVDRLVHNFRVNAGLPSSAEPLGGWEKPDCELRGHFTGHFLSACALMYSSTGDKDIKAKGDAIVAELAKCQAKTGDYLSAFPQEFFKRLDAREKVWAPFYTIHKIMAGMLDMNQHCGNKQVLEVLDGMAHWVDHWTSAIPEDHMQSILGTEYGGMNEILYNLAAVTNDSRPGRVGDRFTKKVFVDPLALRRDELRGLHVNTHIPQVIGAARRYELTGDMRFHDVADYFWYEVTSARAYVTGGTSNAEAWLAEPRRLGWELDRSVNTAECCCAYNMLKLTRHLYQWTGDPRYFDYYERTLFNHRLSAIDKGTGATIYYLSLAPGAWKTFNSEWDSFWCCTGTGVEEFSKLADSIYFRDDDGLYVNLFIPSEVTWPEKKMKLRQETNFPDEQRISLAVTADQPVTAAIRIRVPAWIASPASVKINGKPADATATPGSYIAISRTWKTGDRIEMDVPMSLRVESMPDDPDLFAVMYGPLALAGRLGSEGLTSDLVTGKMGPRVHQHPMDVPSFRPSGGGVEAWVKPAGDAPLTFRTSGQQQDVTLVPFHRLFGERYSVYWRVS